MNEKTPTVYVAGHLGMAGSAIVRRLLASGHPASRLITASRSELDLTNQASVRSFFQENKPDIVYLAAAKVGGIHANSTYPAEFIYDNLMIECNVINAAFLGGVKKLLFLASSCIYPKNSEQPIVESSLLTGSLEPTNEPYSIAKIAGLKLCESYNRQYGHRYDIDYRCVIPTNLYGTGDNFHPLNSHVIPALVRRIHEAKINNNKSVTIWGTGKPLREFMFVDDMASACLHVMNLDSKTFAKKTGNCFPHLNIGAGIEISILSLAHAIKETIGYSGSLVFDSSMPDGVPRKLLDSSLLAKTGWRPEVELSDGLRITYDHFLQRISP